jgi:hypothetical protein
MPSQLSVLNRIADYAKTSHITPPALPSLQETTFFNQHKIQRNRHKAADITRQNAIICKITP